MRGFKDYLPNNSHVIYHIKKIFQQCSSSLGCDFIELPLVEEADLYFRTSGVQSDVCNKELFEVRKYKGEFENWVLRPELTASCIRAVKEQNFMQNNKIARFAYCGPMFRYNRPQKGRYRQFLQAGWEFLGSNSVLLDFELICGAVKFLNAFNIEYTIEINSIGSSEDRQQYRKILQKHFSLDHSVDVLKILDKTELYHDIPMMNINEKDVAQFAALQKLLIQHDVKYIHNPYLIRGLDYYNSTVFEFKAKDGQTLLAGGRYDYLMRQLGGTDLPAVGFAAGVERIAENMHFHYENKKICLICLDAIDYTIKISEIIRKNNECFVFWDLDLKKALAEASKMNFEWVVIAGEKERSQGVVVIKNFILRTECIKKIDEKFDFY